MSARVNQSENESLYSIENIEKFPPSYSEALKLCETSDVPKSLIFCNENLNSYNKYESISSKDSLYSLEMDFQIIQQRNRNPFHNNSLSNCFSDIFVSARKVAKIYLFKKTFIDRSKTVSLNLISNEKSKIKRDYSLPLNFQAAPM